jgi:hypothetical protein
LVRLQASGAVSLRLEKHGAEETATLILSDIRTEEMKRDLAYVLKTLNLEPEKNGQFTIIFGALPRNRRELAVLSRAMSEILLELAVGIDVPSDHVARGWTLPSGRLLGAADPMIGRSSASIRVRPRLPTRSSPCVIATHPTGSTTGYVLEAHLHISDDFFFAFRDWRDASGTGPNDSGKLNCFRRRGHSSVGSQSEAV